MTHVDTIRQDSIRLRDEGVGWELVDHDDRIFGKLGRMGVAGHTRGDKLVKDLGGRFKRYPKKTHEKGETDISAGVEKEEYMSLRMSLRRVSMAESLNVALYVTYLYAINRLEEKGEV